MEGLEVYGYGSGEVSNGKDGRKKSTQGETAGIVQTPQYKLAICSKANLPVVRLVTLGLVVG